MRTVINNEEKKQIKRDLSNIEASDSFEEVIFKMFEQVKAYNTKLADFNKQQKELIKDLKEYEK